MRAVAALLGAMALLAGGPLFAAGAADILPHRAFYSLKLANAQGRSGIVAVEGGMFVEWVESCEGWAVTQRIRLSLLRADYPEVDTDTSFATWESRDGLEYRFHSRTLRNGEVSEELRGMASLVEAGGAGVATFSEPAPLEFVLPTGTVFPTEHMQLLIDAARDGESRLSRIVFDGASLEGPLEVNAVIGGPVAPEDLPPIDDPALADGTSWHMRLAFFPMDSQIPEPTYELGVQLQENGVAREMVLDYSDFAIDARLDRFEALPRPEC
jgi:hypothetical protein